MHLDRKSNLAGCKMQMNRSEISEAFEVDPTTIDRWVRDGMPVVDRPGKGIPASFDLPACLRWKLSADLDKALDRVEKSASAEDLDALKAEGQRLRNEAAQLDLAARKGQLAKIDVMLEMMKSLVIGGRIALMDRVPPRVAALAQAPGSNLQQIIRDEMRAALVDWAEQPLLDIIQEAGGDPDLIETRAAEVAA